MTGNILHPVLQQILPTFVLDLSQNQNSLSSGRLLQLKHHGTMLNVKWIVSQFKVACEIDGVFPPGHEGVLRSFEHFGLPDFVDSVEGGVAFAVDAGFGAVVDQGNLVATSVGEAK